MKKRKVFISHIQEDLPIARVIRQIVQHAFPDACEVFEFVDDTSGGDNLPDKVLKNLKKAAVVLMLCSRESIARWWIGVEGGGGWVLGTRIIPICFGGLKSLPPPLSNITALQLTSSTFSDDLVSALAKSWKLRQRLARQTQSYQQEIESARRDAANSVKRNVSWTRLELEVAAFAHRVSDKLRRVDFIVSFASGGVLIADWLRRALIMMPSSHPAGNLTLVTLQITRIPDKKRGHQARIENQELCAELLIKMGVLQPHAAIVVVDDVVNTGRSIAAVVQFLREKVGVRDGQLFVGALGRKRNTDDTDPKQATDVDLDYCGSLLFDEPMDLPYAKTGSAWKEDAILRKPTRK